MVSASYDAIGTIYCIQAKKKKKQLGTLRYGIPIRKIC